MISWCTVKNRVSDSWNNPSGPLRYYNNSTKTHVAEANPGIKSSSCCWLHNLCPVLILWNRGPKEVKTKSYIVIKRFVILKWKMSRLDSVSAISGSDMHVPWCSVTLQTHALILNPSLWLSSGCFLAHGFLFMDESQTWRYKSFL